MDNSCDKQYTNQREQEEILENEKLWGIRALNSSDDSWEFRRPHACTGRGTCSEKTWAGPHSHLQALLKQEVKVKADL